MNGHSTPPSTWGDLESCVLISREASGANSHAPVGTASELDPGAKASKCSLFGLL